MVFVEEPTTVFPLYVVHVRVQVPVDALGISEAREIAGVHVTLSALVFVAIVPEDDPKEYVIVSVYVFTYRVIPIESEVPSVPFDTVNLEDAGCHTAYRVTVEYRG